MMVVNSGYSMVVHRFVVEDAVGWRRRCPRCIEPMSVAGCHCAMRNIVCWTLLYADRECGRFKWYARARTTASGESSYLGVLRSKHAEDIGFPRATAHLNGFGKGTGFMMGHRSHHRSTADTRYQ